MSLWENGNANILLTWAFSDWTCKAPSPVPGTQQVFVSGSPTLGTVTTAALGGNQARDEEGMVGCGGVALME